MERRSSGSGGVLLGVLAAVAVAVAGCGGGAEAGGTTAATAATPSGTAPAAPVSAFPPVRKGQTIERVLAGVDGGGPEFAPSVSVLAPGDNRVGFGLFGADGTMVREDAVALYVARRDGTQVAGPFPARRESLAVGAAFRSEQTATDATPYVYVSTVRFPATGEFGLVAVLRTGGRLQAGEPVPVKVGPPAAGPPRPGQMAPVIHTQTPEQVGGDLSKLTTRRPPLRSLVDTDFATVAGRKPIVIAFATPQLCQSRVCGPVVDVLAELQARYGERVAFIQQEVYVGNDPQKGLRPQLVRFRLRTEPWTFVIDARGRIAARFEGALSLEELDAAVRGVLQ